MKLITIGANEAGQRLDKFLNKYLDAAWKGFLYKMLRKKNITLNGKKAEGMEMLHPGDEVRLFLSDETIAQFSDWSAGHVTSSSGALRWKILSRDRLRNHRREDRSPGLAEER